MEVAILTHFPSPYQVEFFNGIASGTDLQLRVIYLYQNSDDRLWMPSQLRHNAVFLDLGGSNEPVASSWIKDSELVVFNYYNHPMSDRYLRIRAECGKPWSLWGERLGFRHPVLGRLLRLWKLRQLHKCNAPIWGIGKFALESYRREFGDSRQYVNLPYFSDLDRFVPSERHRDGDPRIILFSGSLIKRKGVDLLARAFRRVVARYSNLRLKLLGSGPMNRELETILEPISERVEFVGFKDWSQLPDQYHTADVLCVPSRHDGWGMVVPEGLASGLPVITSNRTGAGIDLIRHEKNGWIIPAGDLLALESTLETIANLNTLQLNLLRSAALSGIEGHSLQHGVNRFVSACHSAIENF